MSPTWNQLPPQFVDRPRLERWWVNILVVLRLRTVKAVCCESYLKGKVACKGCPKIYDKQSSRPIYRWIARRAKQRPPR